ncbi:hypothetical protein BDW22DRAFT_430833 [Trametopsis cervina]|nr:hypothetical protein BDW22DRAFT_430833 [Trametopsis cervina]
MFGPRQIMRERATLAMKTCSFCIGIVAVTSLRWCGAVSKWSGELDRRHCTIDSGLLDAVRRTRWSAAWKAGIKTGLDLAPPLTTASDVRIHPTPLSPGRKG